MSTDSVEYFKDWFSEFGDTGQFTEPAPELLKAALVKFGAKPENITAAVRPCLSKYTNEGRAPAMRAIWGHRFNLYKKLMEMAVSDYESRTGLSVPALSRSKSKISGLIQVFGEITALAFGGVTYHDIAPFLEARVTNGRLHALGKKDEKVRLVTPNAVNEGPKLVSSVYPGFHRDMLATFSSWRGKPWLEAGTEMEEE